MIINLTPHEVSLPTGPVGRVSVELADAGHHDGVPLVRGTYGRVADLPEPSDGLMYVVSAMVRAACPHRDDLASPALLVRDEAGRIIGCEALEVS